VPAKFVFIVSLLVFHSSNCIQLSFIHCQRWFLHFIIFQRNIGTYVCIFMLLTLLQDLCWRRLSDQAQKALESVGSSYSKQISFRDAWALIGRPRIHGYSPFEEVFILLISVSQWNIANAARLLCMFLLLAKPLFRLFLFSRYFLLLRQNITSWSEPPVLNDLTRVWYWWLTLHCPCVMCPISDQPCNQYLSCSCSMLSLCS